MKNRRVLKIIAGMAAFLLIGGMLLVMNAFIGNPISAMMARNATEKYVDQNYSLLNLEVEKPTYNFKYNAYMARAVSKTSIDTHFSIYYRSGKVEWDDYDSHVLGLFNTVQRLSEEYSVIAREIISRELGYKGNRTMVSYSKDESERYKEVVELDMKFDRSIPLESEVMIRLDMDESSLEESAEILEKAHRAFVANDCHFDQYSFYTENKEGTLIMINGIEPKDIQGGELLTLLESVNETQDGTMGKVSVFIKNP